MVTAGERLYLSRILLKSRSPCLSTRDSAKYALYVASCDFPDYPLTILHLTTDPTLPEAVRDAAAMDFSSYLHYHWPVEDLVVLAPEKRIRIKSVILSAMLSPLPPTVQSEVGKALATISQNDVPEQWPELLPTLAKNLCESSQSRPPDYTSVACVLFAANCVFQKFRHQRGTASIDFQYSVDIFWDPLLVVFRRTASLIEEVRKGVDPGFNSTMLFKSQRLCCLVYRSLNFQPSPGFFADRMGEWIGEFEKYLTSRYPAVEGDGDSSEGTAAVDGLRDAVCMCLGLYMDRDDEGFQGYMGRFFAAVWSLLGEAAGDSHRDGLAITAMKFFASLSTGVHHALFAREGVIPHICRNFVIPSVVLRDDDVELFWRDYVMFIRRDMKVRDPSRRRRMACEMLMGIATKYKTEVIRAVSAQIENLLASFSAYPVDKWKDKACAIFLVVSLFTIKAGFRGEELDSELVDVESFFGSVVAPELHDRDLNNLPLLKAGALKFFIVFRHRIPKTIVLQLIPDLVRCLGVESKVVRSYAASCIEKLLLVTDDDGRTRYDSTDIAAVLPSMMRSLFGALRLPELDKNHYVMKCVWRVLGVAKLTRELAASSMTVLTSILEEIREKEPMKNPVYSRRLFDSVDVLLHRGCEALPGLLDLFGEILFPCLVLTLRSSGGVYFNERAHWLLAELVERNWSPHLTTYLEVFWLLLDHDVWRLPYGMKAQVHLMKTLIEKFAPKLREVSELRGRFFFFFIPLVAPARNEKEGCLSGINWREGQTILNAMLEENDYGEMLAALGRFCRVDDDEEEEDDDEDDEEADDDDEEDNFDGP